MATIPLYNDGQMPGAPEAAAKALVPEARYQADYAGLAQAAAQAYEQPELPDNWGKGDVIAGEAWGKAMSTLGGAMTELAEQSAKARNYADLEEARDHMQNETLRFEQWRLENPDSDGWQAEWQRRVTATQKYFSEKRYAPVVRSQVDRDVNQFGERGLIQAGIDAAKVQFSRAGAAVQQARGRAVQQRSIQGVADAGNQAVALKLETPQQSDENTRRAVQDIYANQRTAMVETQPEVVLKYAQDPKAKNLPAAFVGLNDATWTEVKTDAQESVYWNQKALLENLRDAVRTNAVATDADREKWIQTHVPQGMRDATLSTLMQRVMQGGPPDMAEVFRLKKAIGSHDPTAPGARLQQVWFRLQHAQYPREMQLELDKALATRINSGKPESLAAQEGRTLIRTWHDQEALRDSNGEPIRYRGPKYLFDALADKEKLEVFGLGFATDRLRAIKGPQERWRSFLSLKGTFGKDASPEAMAKLTPFTRELFEKSLRGEEFVNPETRNASAMRAMELEQAMDGFLQAYPNASPKQVVEWLTDHTSLDRRGAGARALESPAQHRRREGRRATLGPDGAAIVRPPSPIQDLKAKLKQ
ncbi:hypothetical protein [Roseimicrobium sp. ORNL1]|uniref:hypothetical protein n=1 Tax=Roseimicrobium sp. ORNL1 TaxID=2711231 RepID=UPI0013E144D2|nr:hypothetical protein [Roseimicrobium sp. ORNL1]QIF01922.1 hypothetical protein G5S37_10405 [Roseimicrobium sp. ORNL1]